MDRPTFAVHAGEMEWEQIGIYLPHRNWRLKPGLNALVAEGGYCSPISLGPREEGQDS